MNSEQHSYAFGPFRLDTADRQLLREGRVVPLTPKAFDVLVVLVENSRRTVEKDDLMKRVWPSTCVEEVNLANNVSLLRKVLGTGEGEGYIQTVPRRGYRFAAEVKELRDEANDRQNGSLARSECQGGQIVPQTRVSVEQTQEEPIKESSQRWAGRRLLLQSLTACIVLIGIAAVGFYLRTRSNSNRSVEVASIKSIAVLPFKPLVAGSRDEMIEMGIADSLITRLGNLREIIVRPISSVRKYTELDQDAVAAGREQQADVVLDGTYQKVDDRLRITARLYRVRDGSVVWTDNFDQELTDVLAVQDSISIRVSEALALRLTREELRLLTKRPTGSSKAYDLYLRGRYYWEQRTPNGMKKAIDCFQGAINQDPNYALAYVGLADTYHFNKWLGFSFKEGHAKQKAAAMKALELDATLAEAHTSMAYLLLFEDAFSEAEREFKRSIELNPNYPSAHHWYSNYLRKLGRYEEGLVEIKRARELDPRSLIINATLGEALSISGRDDEGIEQLKNTLEMDPKFSTARVMLGDAYTRKRMYDEALAEYDKVKLEYYTPGEELPTLQEFQPYIYAALGKRDEVLKSCEKLKKRPRDSVLETLDLARIYATLGEKEQAFELLKTCESVAMREPGFAALIKSDSKLENLRSDPRFADLMRRVGL